MAVFLDALKAYMFQFFGLLTWGELGRGVVEVQSTLIIHMLHEARNDCRCFAIVYFPL